MWVKAADDAYVNLDLVASLRPIDTGTQIRIEVRSSGFSVQSHIDGPWTTLEEGRQVVRKLVDAVDAETY